MTSLLAVCAYQTTLFNLSIVGEKRSAEGKDNEEYHEFQKEAL